MIGLELGDKVIVRDTSSFLLGAIGEIKIIDDISFQNTPVYLVNFETREEFFFEEELEKL